MKKTLLILLIAIGSLVLIAQPAPELLYSRTGSNPAFISIDMSQVGWDDGDYLFTYADSLCFGSNPVNGDRSFVVAYGKDQYDPGFAFNQNMRFGYYDANTKISVELIGSTFNQNGNMTIPRWMSLNLLKFTVKELGDTIQLKVNPALSDVAIITSLKSTWSIAGSKTDNIMYFKLDAKNVDGLNVTTNGAGNLSKVKRWVYNSWVNFAYTVEPSDNDVLFIASGQNKWTGADVLEQYQVKIDRDKAPNPEGDLYANQYFKLYKAGNWIFIEALTSTPVYVNFNINGVAKTKYIVSSRGTKPGDKKQVCGTVNTKELTINWAMYKGVDGRNRYHWTGRKTINKTVSW